MKHYYFNINKDQHGRHEVHTEECSFLPNVSNRKYIGYANNCSEALEKASAANPTMVFDGCFYCSKPCHRG